MPHVVLTGDASRVNLCQALVPIVENRDAWRVKIDDIYIERRGNRALASAVVIEEDHPQIFYIVVARNDARSAMARHAAGRLPARTTLPEAAAAIPVSGALESPSGTHRKARSRN